MSWYRRLLRYFSDSVLPWGGSVLLHGAAVVLLTFSLGFRHEATPVATKAGDVQAIEAVVVDAALLDAEVARLAAIDRVREDRARVEREAAAEATRAREREEQRLRQLQVEREAAEQAQREQQARLEQLAREAAERERRAAAEEAQRRAAQEEAARRAAEEEAKRRAEAEAKRLAEQKRAEEKRREEARLAAEREAKRQAEQAAQREAEQQLLAALGEEENRRANSGLLAQYKAQVKQKVERNWARPPEAQAGLSCEVNVRQLRDGQVISVEFGRCNGNATVQRSIEGAVYRASPLPPPPDPSLFDQYLVFIFEPQ